MAGNQIDVYVELETPVGLLHRVVVEVKDWSRSVGIDVVNKFSTVAALLRTRGLIDEGVIVSAGGFSQRARDAARTHCIHLLDKADLEAMVARVQAAKEPLLTTAPSFPHSLPQTAQTQPETTQVTETAPVELTTHPSESIPPSEAMPQESIRSVNQRLHSSVTGQMGTDPKVFGPPITILIPAGPFWMGSSLGDLEACDNERPRRQHDIPEYHIARYPVTNAEYSPFVFAVGYAPPTHWDDSMIPSGLEDHPVVNVSFEDANAYCRWLSQITGRCYRLPTEEEWEKAARGGMPETRCYPWGDEWLPGVCNTQEEGLNATTSVHKFEKINQSPWGVIDMVGNVWEWTASPYERHPASTHKILPYGLHYRVVRGGSWRNSCREARISCRGRYKPNIRRSYLGFRIAMDSVVSPLGVFSHSAPKGSDDPFAEPPDLAIRLERGHTGERNRSSTLDKEATMDSEKGKLSRVKRSELREKLRIHFDESELRDLCFDLGIDYDGLRGEGTGDKTRELIAYLERRGRISELLKTCGQLRPHTLW
jgi:formylglycine-generating enzyme required for sulfatase activity